MCGEADSWGEWNGKIRTADAAESSVQVEYGERDHGCGLLAQFYAEEPALDRVARI